MSEYLDKTDFQFFYKPSGIPTHRPSEGHTGFVEWVSRQLRHDYLVCHRLDKETSGAIVFARTKKAAQVLGELFATQQVKKSYLFVSDKKSPELEWTFVEKMKGARGGERPIGEGQDISPTTKFQRVLERGQLYLYRAFPLTGKTHQIRKHAARSEVPILGDEEYGGSPFPRLMLHSESIAFELNGEKIEFKAEPSQLFQDISICTDRQLSAWIHSYERRKILFQDLIADKKALRLLHNETEDLRVDQVGDHWVMGWWKKSPPSSNEQKKLQAFAEMFSQEKWHFQWRPGGAQNAENSVELGSKNKSEQWHFYEGPVQYLASMNRGQNLGLFLDQRDQRSWVRENSAGKKVLNLFAFTCGFSVNAAVGGATQVVSVDVSRKYLDWGKENFALNNLDPEAPQFEFRAIDALAYLNFAKKKSLQFDIIICDPPSFARNKKDSKIFRIEEDYAKLLQSCASILSPQGALLFSTNFETWDLDSWVEKLEPLVAKLGFLQCTPVESQFDFEWQKKHANLKAFFFSRACENTKVTV